MFRADAEGYAKARYVCFFSCMQGIEVFASVSSAETSVGMV